MNLMIKTINCTKRVEKFLIRHNDFIKKAPLKICVQENQANILYLLVNKLLYSSIDLTKISFNISIAEEIIIYAKDCICLDMIVIDQEGDIMIGHTSLNSKTNSIKFIENKNINLSFLINSFSSNFHLNALIIINDQRRRNTKVRNI